LVSLLTQEIFDIGVPDLAGAFFVPAFLGNFDLDGAGPLFGASEPDLMGLGVVISVVMIKVFSGKGIFCRDNVELVEKFEKIVSFDQEGVFKTEVVLSRIEFAVHLFVGDDGHLSHPFVRHSGFDLEDVS